MYTLEQKYKVIGDKRVGCRGVVVYEKILQQYEVHKMSATWATIIATKTIQKAL